MSNEEKDLDNWEIALIQKKAELEKCQKEHSLQSCLSCKEMLDCQLRDSYVKSVYDSMNKGTGGGFEF